MDASLYGHRDPNNTKSKHRPLANSTASTFTSNLAGLISATKSKNVSRASPPPASALKRKADIFTSHNRNVKARAASDLEQVHKTKNDLDSVSASAFHRSNRKMEEKARLYNQMKRGEYIGRSDNASGLVDFDRKWSEKEEKGANSDDEGSSDDGAESEGADETVEWTDEFGRLRKGSKHEKDHFERQQRIQNSASTAAQEDSARPQAPSNIIYGDAVQTEAFNPDRDIAAKMAGIAAKRDKSATPPPEVHYQASAEIRNRGTGFYAFSGDSEMRREEMESLERERIETERARQERDEAKENRRKDIDERRRAIEAKRKERVEKDADKFLDSLDIQVPPAG